MSPNCKRRASQIAKLVHPRHAGLILLLLALVSVFIGGLAMAAKPQSKPNILVILADDLGIECVQSFGGLSYQTPNIDALVTGGVQFTHCFSTPYCTPSRAQLLTGRYPLHNGMRRVIYLPKQHREFLDPGQEVSFATVLRDAGYATAIAGKWQVSFLHERDTVRELGFDDYQLWQIFVDGQKTSRYANPAFRQNGRLLEKELQGAYGPDVNAKFLIDFMSRNRERPFLAYYTALLPHWPWEPTPDSAEPLKAAIGIGDAKYMPEMVAYLDKQVGQLVDALEQLGLRENTLVLFVADNGTDQRLKSQWRGPDGARTVQGGKGKLTDSGTRVPLVANWPGRIEGGRKIDDLIDLSDFFPTLLEIAQARPAPNPINGRSFAAQLRGEKGRPRAWIHVQRENNRYVRNRKYIFTNRGAMRPVVEIGQKPAKPLSGSLTEDQQAAKKQLQAALANVADLGKSDSPNPAPSPDGIESR